MSISCHDVLSARVSFHFVICYIINVAFPCSTAAQILHLSVDLRATKLCSRGGRLRVCCTATQSSSSFHCYGTTTELLRKSLQRECISITICFAPSSLTSEYQRHTVPHVTLFVTLQQYFISFFLFKKLLDVLSNSSPHTHTHTSQQPHSSPHGITRPQATETTSAHLSAYQISCVNVVLDIVVLVM
jgi:hypothetical protein